MKEMVCYGAGNLAKKGLPILMKRYKIPYIIDCDKKKHGKKLYDIQIIPVNKKTVNCYPVVVMVENIKSVLNTLYIEMDCHVPIYRCIEYAGGYIVVEYRKDSVFPLVFDRSLFIPGKFEMINILYNQTKFNPQKRRYFDIASTNNFYSTGGPGACLRNLWKANEEFHLIENFYTLCPGTIYVPRGSYFEDISCLDIEENNLMKAFLENITQCTDDAAELCFYLRFLVEFLKKVNEKFGFREQDIFLLQDPFIVHVFIHCFPTLTNVVVANHVQGTLHNELEKKYPELVSVYDAMQLEHLTRIRNWIFPSKGAQEGFLSTASSQMKQAAQKCVFHVAYNGYESKDKIKPDLEFVEQLDGMKKADITFASATFLYRNKGVERIPRVLSEFKKITGLSIRWILVGSGEMEVEVEENIRKYLKDSEYIWYRKRFDNQDNIFELFSQSDFYIMMHRVSVFDLSTLQAMSYGCIPFLSDVGGNIELCGFQNGILVDPDKPNLEFLDRLKNERYEVFLEQKKNKNKEIVKRYFNNRRFLNAYKRVLYMIDK